MTEAQIQKGIMAKFKLLGEMVFKMHLLFITGVPDLLFILRGGRVMWMEVKQPGEQPTKKQEWFHKQLRALGHHVSVVHSYEEALLAYKVYHAQEKIRISQSVQAECRKVFDPDTYQKKGTNQEATKTGRIKGTQENKNNC